MPAALTAALAVALLALGGCATAPRPTGVVPPPTVVPSNEGGFLDERDVFIDAAEKMQGQPYRWGGSAPGGFDCSGLVAYAAAIAKIAVPRTAHEQILAGIPVTRAALDKGDLVFMRLKAKELHVGIAIDHAHFVHAPSSGGFVRIDSLDAAPYAQNFVAARRIVTSRQSAALP